MIGVELHGIGTLRKRPGDYARRGDGCEPHYLAGVKLRRLAREGSRNAAEDTHDQTAAATSTASTTSIVTVLRPPALVIADASATRPFSKFVSVAR